MGVVRNGWYNSSPFTKRYLIQYSMQRRRNDVSPVLVQCGYDHLSGLLTFGLVAGERLCGYERTPGAFTIRKRMPWVAKQKKENMDWR